MERWVYASAIGTGSGGPDADGGYFHCCRTRNLFPPRHRRSPPARRKALRIARDQQSGAAAREARPSRSSAQDARRHLRLVHRRLRYRRPERGDGIVRGAEHLVPGPRPLWVVETPNRGVPMVSWVSLLAVAFA